MPIEEWQSLKSKYSELEEEEAKNFVEPGLWQKQIIDERLTNYYSNPQDVSDFNDTIDDIEKSL